MYSDDGGFEMLVKFVCSRKIEGLISGSLSDDQGVFTFMDSFT